MTEKVDEKAVELMDRTADAVEAFAIKLEALTTEYGPEVVDAALWVARIDALQDLMSAITLTVFALITFFVARPIIRWGHRIDPNGQTPAAFSGYVSGFISVILGAISIVRLLDPWPWVGIIEPQLWIAKRILGL